MSFTHSIRTCFRKYVTFSGRASRPEFWWFAFFFLFLNAISGWINETVGLPDVSYAVQQVHGDARVSIGFSTGLLDAVILVVLIIPLLAAGSRRLRDAGLWSGVIFAPLAGIVLSVGAIVLINIASDGAASVPPVIVLLVVLGSLVLTVLGLVQPSRRTPAVEAPASDQIPASQQGQST